MRPVGEILHGNADLASEGGSGEALREAIARAELECATREDGLVDEELREASSRYGGALMSTPRPLEPIPLLDTRALQILRHALGIGDNGRGAAYRNHFVTGEGSRDHPFCMALVEAGCMTRRSGSPLTGGDDLFMVTRLGKLAAKGDAQVPA